MPLALAKRLTRLSSSRSSRTPTAGEVPVGGLPVRFCRTPTITCHHLEHVQAEMDSSSSETTIQEVFRATRPEASLVQNPNCWI